MFYVRPACICVMILAMSGSACRYPDRKHDPSAQRKADVDTATNLSRIEIPPDLRAFFDGNHLYMSQHFDVTGGGKQVVVAQGGLKITVDPPAWNMPTVLRRRVTFMCASWNCGTAEISSVIIWLQ